MKDLQDNSQLAAHVLRKTRMAFLCIHLLNTPFWVILTVFPFILYKDLHISPFQITMMIALKPLSALLAPYWSLPIYKRQDRLISNLTTATVLQYLPFLFFPWISSAWVMIVAFSFFMMLRRGIIPTWMAIFKQNIPEIARERVFSYGMMLDYLGDAVLPLGLGIVLDQYPLSWHWIFPSAALLGLSSIIFLFLIPKSLFHQAPITNTTDRTSLMDLITKPWKQSWQLMKQRPDFRRFQLGFMLGGAGLMVMHPALPMFFVDVLQLSYTNMMCAIVACKAIGVVSTSPLWTRFFRKVNIFRFSGCVTLFAALFPFFLISAQYSLNWLYIAYFFYGVMQAGSELSWHLSGPLFAKEEENSLFSRTNVLTVGMRGCVFPFLGSLLYSVTNSATVMLFGAGLCLLATQSLLTYKRPKEEAIL